LSLPRKCLTQISGSQHLKRPKLHRTHLPWLCRFARWCAVIFSWFHPFETWWWLSSLENIFMPYDDELNKSKHIIPTTKIILEFISNIPKIKQVYMNIRFFTIIYHFTLNARLYCRLYLFNNCEMNILYGERCSFIHVDGLLLFAMYVSIYFIGYLSHKERERE